MFKKSKKCQYSVHDIVIIFDRIILVQIVPKDHIMHDGTKHNLIETKLRNLVAHFLHHLLLFEDGQAFELITRRHKIRQSIEMKSKIERRICETSMQFLLF